MPSFFEMTGSAADELLAFAETTAPDLFGRRQREAIAALSARHQELEALLDRCAAADPARAVRLSEALWRYWFLRGHLARAIPPLRRR